MARQRIPSRLSAALPPALAPLAHFLGRRFDRLDQAIVRWLARWSIPLTRLALGVVFAWFGALKLFPGLSPAEDLAGRTILTLTFGLIEPAVSRPLLGIWEVAIGLGLLLGRWRRLTILLLLAQMAGTLLPLAFYPGDVFQRAPYAPTLEGQYIIKNLVLISATLVIGSTARGGRLQPEPAAAPTPSAPTAAHQTSRDRRQPARSRLGEHRH